MSMANCVPWKMQTPLSFASSFLAVPSRDFPQNDTASAVGWGWWQVVVAIGKSTQVPGRIRSRILCLQSRQEC